MSDWNKTIQEMFASKAQGTAHREKLLTQNPRVGMMVNERKLIMPEPLFYATSLETIAKMFDRNKDQANARARATTKVRDHAVLVREANIWEAAADILRSTKLIDATSQEPAARPD